MNKNARTIDVTIEELAERLGLWCDRCLLPSRAEWDFAVLFDGKVEYTFTYGFCADCEHETRVGFA